MTFDLAAVQWHPDKILFLEIGCILWGLDHFKAKNKILHLKSFHMTPTTAT